MISCWLQVGAHAGQQLEDEEEEKNGGGEKLAIRPRNKFEDESKHSGIPRQPLFKIKATDIWRRNATKVGSTSSKLGHQDFKTQPASLWKPSLVPGRSRRTAYRTSGLYADKPSFLRFSSGRTDGVEPPDFAILARARRCQM